jgi:hypothetical protein
MWDAHRLHRRRDRSRIGDRSVLADAPERDMCPERLGIEGDLATAELGANALTELEERGRTCTDSHPDDARFAGSRKAARAIQLDIEGGDSTRGRLDRGLRIIKALVGGLSQKGERDVHQLRLHATDGGKIRSAAERRFSDFGGEWQRDEEPYPRRLELREG